MPDIRVAAFNAHDNADRYWNQISQNLGPTDVLILPEAYKQSAGLVSRLQETGLKAAEVPYNDQDRRADIHYLVIAGAPEVLECIEPI